jgi:hypothetical protein
MRARDFIVEKHQGKISKRSQQPSRGILTYSDSEKANSDYTQYRLGLALACANGKDPIDVDYKTWFGKKKTMHPYSQVEQDMINQAFKVVGADYDDINKGDLESKELDSTNTVSPVSNWNNKGKK